MSANQADLLSAAGITPERWSRGRLLALSDRERLLYRWILTSFRAGAPPSGSELAKAASELELELEVEPALAKLAREDLVHYDSSSGEMVVAYPFSGRPTAHRVRFETAAKHSRCARSTHSG